MKIYGKGKKKFSFYFEYQFSTMLCAFKIQNQIFVVEKQTAINQMLFNNSYLFQNRLVGKPLDIIKWHQGNLGRWSGLLATSHESYLGFRQN